MRASGPPAKTPLPTRQKPQVCWWCLPGTAKAIDDLSWVVHHGYLDMDLVARALRARRRDVHVVLAGRYMPMEWLDMADMATEMRQVTHPYPKKAIAPQAGVDF